MSGSVTIRRLGLVDAPALIRLFNAVLDEFSAQLAFFNDNGPEKFLADQTSFALGAYDLDEPVGLAWGIQMRSPNGRLTHYLHELSVRDQWRRQGVATALVTEAISLARAAGSNKFWLSTGAHNEGAQALYASLGGDRKPLGDVNYWWSLG